MLGKAPHKHGTACAAIPRTPSSTTVGRFPRLPLSSPKAARRNASDFRAAQSEAGEENPLGKKKRPRAVDSAADAGRESLPRLHGPCFKKGLKYRTSVVYRGPPTSSARHFVRLAPCGSAKNWRSPVSGKTEAAALGHAIPAAACRDVSLSCSWQISHLWEAILSAIISHMREISRRPMHLAP